MKAKPEQTECKVANWNVEVTKPIPETTGKVTRNGIIVNGIVYSLATSEQSAKGWFNL